MNVVLLGASKGIGRALARAFAERGDRLTLLGRDTADLERSARDLEARGAPAPVAVVACDLAVPETFAPALDAAAAALGRIDTVVLTAGAFATQDALEADAMLAGRVLDIDFTGSVLFCEEARKRLLAEGGGTLCALSSVAGERGRKPVILYGAAKAGLTRYLEGLDHKFRSQGAARRLRQARLRQDVDDPGPEAAAVRRRARGTSRATCCGRSTVARRSSTRRACGGG
jgi:NAD(P)-dependent dehydrogenase (short-subunit alcohol dehydrogenase family)